LGIDGKPSPERGSAGDPLPPTAFAPDWLYFHAERSPDRPAVASPTSRLTYGDLAARVRALANQLATRGIGPGSRVLVALPNTPATVVASLAVNALGGTSVEVNREWSAETLGDIVAKGGIRELFVLARDARMWGTALQGCAIDHIWGVHQAALDAAFLEAVGHIPATLLLEDGRIDPNAEVAPPAAMHTLSADLPALVLYTSGSTRTPHGVIQTFRNVDANTRSIVEYLDLTAEDRALVTLPFYYSYGRSILQTHLLAGGSVFLDNRMAFPRIVLEALASEGCTGFAGVPLTFELIRRQVDVSTIHFRRLRYLTQAGGEMAPETIAWVRTAFQPAKLYVMYGQTEATARLSYLPPDRAEDKAGSIGIGIPGVELQVVDELGRELPDGEIGELVARGQNVTPGYLEQPGETAAIVRDGWLWTGDLAYRDADGFFFYRGRLKEILKIGGHRVSPAEIEHVLARHPGVADVAVLGLRDDLMGEVPGAVLVPRGNPAPSETELLEFCRERLPSYQVPVSFVFAEALPRNESGKLLRAEVAAQFIARFAAFRGELDPSPKDDSRAFEDETSSG
jgi:long-chain acyl-CoA synthetase